MKHQLKACGVLVYQGDAPRHLKKFLLMKHPHRWDLPKGHVDPGERDDIVTALRELNEETGLPADAIEIDPEFRFTTQYQVTSRRTGGEPWPKTVVIFLGRLIRDLPIVISEHEGYRWFDWNPPHQIQKQTIDPLLQSVETFIREQAGHP